jgi:hypothetical protein
VAGTISLASSPAKAGDGMVEVSVRHNINGRSLGLSKDLPVVAKVTIETIMGDVVKADVPLVFKERFSELLPPGNYSIQVFLQTEDGEVLLESMSLGPVEIMPGSDVSILARLSAGKTPILDAKVR